MPAAPRPPADDNADTARIYVVLKQSPDDPKAFTVVKEVEATNDQQAIKQATSGATREGSFVAVPQRSWRLRTRKIENVEKDVWS